MRGIRTSTYAHSEPKKMMKMENDVGKSVRKRVLHMFSRQFYSHLFTGINFFFVCVAFLLLPS